MGAAEPLSIVVVTWNSAEDLARLLASVDRHLQAPHELVIVDNASGDDSIGVAEGWPGERQLLRLEENAGFGAATNRGVVAAHHERVVLLNPDTYLVDGSLSALADLAVRTGALYGPEVLNDDGTRQPSASPPPASWEVGLAALAPHAILPPRLRFRCDPWRAPRTREVGWLTGACIAAPRSLLLELGPFDESIHLYGEDMELGLRARQHGIRSLFAPDVARVVHLGGRSAEQRFDDLGLGLKIAARRDLVRRHVGPRREMYDHAAQVTFHAGRYVAKTALRRSRDYERQWLMLARPGRARSDPPAAPATSPPPASRGRADGSR
jgi:N-acetylglucosaminyl-diphospho-decaprenol L-rhamnosyltransferase